MKANDHAPESKPKGTPYGTPDDYCRAITGHSWTGLVSTAKELTGDPELSAEAMQAELARMQKKYKGPGGDRKSEEYKRQIKRALGTNDPGNQGSNSSQYLLRRITRERPDILKRYETGEFKTVKAAVREAGLVKEPTPFEAARKALIRKGLASLVEKPNWRSTGVAVPDHLLAHTSPLGWSHISLTGDFGSRPRSPSTASGPSTRREAASSWSHNPEFSFCPS